MTRHKDGQTQLHLVMLNTYLLCSKTTRTALSHIFSFYLLQRAGSTMADSNILYILLHDPTDNPNPRSVTEAHMSPSPWTQIEHSRQRDKQRGRHYQPALFVGLQPTCWLVINPLGFTEWMAILRHTLSTKECTAAADS